MTAVDASSDLLDIHRTALALRTLEAPAGAAGRVVLVTSARAGEGKTFVSGLLARALASQRDGDVLLIQAGPGGLALGAAQGPGLRGLLEGQAVAELPRPAGADTPGLWQLPPGEGLEPAHLFRAAHWRSGLAALRQRFAVILIDGPALSAVGALLSVSDRSLLVVDASRTPGPAVRGALDAALAAAGLPPSHVAGVLLNRQPRGLPRWLGGG